MCIVVFWHFCHGNNLYIMHVDYDSMEIMDLNLSFNQYGQYFMH